MFEQTVQTQIRLLLKEQSDLGLHCLPFHLHFLDGLLHCKFILFHLKDSYGNSFRCPILRFFTVFTNILQLTQGEKSLTKTINMRIHYFTNKIFIAVKTSRIGTDMQE